MSKKPKEKDIDPVVKQYLSDIGRTGGQTSRGGGRPRRKDEEMTDAQKKNRARNEAAKAKRAGKTETV